MTDGETDGLTDGDTLGLSDGLMLGLTLGLTLGDAPPVGNTDGISNCCTGSPSSAAFMNAVQMRAGKDPPVTDLIPPTPDIEMGLPSAPSLTSMTAAARSGV